ncbi:hypothetical protein [Halobiforma nitratireducens]|uniref:DUF8106 domain-containing protein n=1 Tax=Halobiforma nitratireducens JCM 10879 TaxID=1227454 RepID=M0L8J9_9EURY|nr:hypothetical protein [Halobiforma nitratireducens]EMA29408.1 hypothetical protein C446_17137 [Halobiforma nitratireducens JCM 10879]
MTRFDPTTGDERDERVDASIRRKSLLYCWSCSHTSPADEDGDWTRHTRANAVAYVCPDCGTTIAKRPRWDGSASSRRPVVSR